MRYEVVFTGRVQGVGFRAAAHGLARERGVSGWVRNEPDGTVTLSIEGERALVEEYLTALRERMRGCIDRERKTETEEHRGYAGFEIRR